MTNAVVAGDWASVLETPRLRALCGFAEKLTRDPGACSEEDLAPLREVGLADRALLDLVLVIGYFNFVNRIASGLVVQMESDSLPHDV